MELNEAVRDVLRYRFLNQNDTWIAMDLVALHLAYQSAIENNSKELARTIKEGLNQVIVKPHKPYRGPSY